MTSARIWAAVPVKGLASAKQRLAPLLAPHLRRGLVLAMLGDVLAALADTPGLAGVVVISPDTDVLAVAAAAGAVGVVQQGDIGFAASADAAALAVLARGATGLMVVPGDVPLAGTEDFAAVLAARPGDGCTIVPAWDGGGTNCLLVTPPDAIGFLFGADSFRRHLRAATARGLATQVVRRVGLERDIDQPADLLRLASQPCGRHVDRFLQGWDAPALAPCVGGFDGPF